MANHSGTHRDVCRLVPLFISVLTISSADAQRSSRDIQLSQFNVPSSVLGPGAKCRMRNNEWKISEFEPGDIISQPLALMVLLTET